MFPSSSGNDGSGSDSGHPDKRITLHRNTFGKLEIDLDKLIEQYQDEGQGQGQGEDEAEQQQPEQSDRPEDQQQRRPSPSSPLARNPTQLPAQERVTEPQSTSSQTSAVDGATLLRALGAPDDEWNELLERYNSPTGQGAKDVATGGSGGASGSGSGQGNVGGDFTKNSSRSNSKTANGKNNSTCDRGNNNDDTDRNSSEGGSGNKAPGADDDSNIITDDEYYETRAAVANEAARILCASCYAGAKIAETEDPKLKKKQRKEPREKKHKTWTAGDVQAAKREQQEKEGRRMTFEEFMDIVDPYPRQFWNVWGKKVPTNLQVYSFGEQWGEGQGGEKGDGGGKFPWKKLGKKSFRSLRLASRRGESSTKEASATENEASTTENQSRRESGEVFQQPVYGNKSSLDNPKGDGWHETAEGSGSQHAAATQHQSRSVIAPWTTPPHGQHAAHVGNPREGGGGTMPPVAVPNYSRKGAVAGPASKAPVSSAQPKNGGSIKSSAKDGEGSTGDTTESSFSRQDPDAGLNQGLSPRDKGKGKAVDPGPSTQDPSAEAGPSRSQGVPPASTSTSPPLISRQPSPVRNRPPTESQDRHELNFRRRAQPSQTLRQNTSATASQTSKAGSQEHHGTTATAATQTEAPGETQSETQGGEQGEHPEAGATQGENPQDEVNVGGLDGSDERRTRRDRLRDFKRRIFGRHRKDKPS
jgi:hypothetical protein